jgi:hypothetical protein
MKRISLLRGVSALVTLCVVSMGFVQAAHAGVIGTNAVVGFEERAMQVERIQDLIASDQVRARLVALGVDPAWASERVASMTDAELARLSGQMDQMPAGAGLIEVVGIVFIVLLILELTGVIDIFKKV